MKLHLGCGEKYLQGYVNIDYPASYESVQKARKVDAYGDILLLTYPSGSIEEIRLHHVFEHFPRPIALALVAAWNRWLKPQGRLRIEVPDFTRTARVALSMFSSRKRKKTALRHLYGSHEAAWAVHYEGYSFELLRELLNEFGFQIASSSRNSWMGTCNIEITATKKFELDEAWISSAAVRYFRGFLVSEKDEGPLLASWLWQFRRQFAVSTAQGGGEQGYVDKKAPMDNEITRS